MNSNTTNKITDFIFRISLAVVVIWIGSNELFYPSVFISYLPTFLGPEKSSIALDLIMIHGAVLICTALSLIFNTLTRLSAFIISLILGSILINSLISDGLSEVGFICIGLLGLSIFLVFPKKNTRVLGYTPVKSIYPEKLSKEMSKPFEEIKK